MDDRDQIFMLSVFEILASAELAWATNWNFLYQWCLLPLHVGMSHPEFKFIVSKIDSVFKIVWISQIHV